MGYVKWVAATLCGYEVVSIALGKTPTLTQLSKQHRWLAPALVGALTFHLYRNREKGACVAPRKEKSAEIIP